MTKIELVTTVLKYRSCKFEIDFANERICYRGRLSDEDRVFLRQFGAIKLNMKDINGPYNYYLLLNRED